MDVQDKFSYVITTLPRNKQNNHVKWREVVGMNVQIKYSDAIYDIKVVAKNKKILTIEYKNQTCNINQDQFLQGGIGKIIGKYVIAHRFQVGDVIDDEHGKIQILQLINAKDNDGEKAYKYKCLKCGYVGIVSENKLYHRNVRCQVCCAQSKILVKEINTVGAMYPELIKYFNDAKDADLYLPGSSKKITVKCPTCGHIHDVAVYKLVTKGFYCPQCYSTNSYPNKLMMSILKYLNIKFIPEKVFSWSDKKQYDFYLPNFNCIIEMHGSGHYNGIHHTPAATIQLNDKYKKNLAISNNITRYIEIDCKNESLEYIKHNIITNDELKKIIDVDKINFELCDNNINPDITQNILEKWNQYHNVPDIINDLGISKHIVIRRLKICTKLGLISYDPKYQINLKSRKKVYDKINNVSYESILACAKALEVSRPYITHHSERFIINE